MVADELRSAALASDVIVTCTTAEQPFLERAMVGAGTFIAAVGADEPADASAADTAAHSQESSAPQA